MELRQIGGISAPVTQERSLETVGFVDLLAAPSTKRRWSDKAKGRLVAETLVPGVTLNEVARRHGVKANHLSSWWALARKGKLVVPESAGAWFAAPTAVTQTLEPPIVIGTIDLVIGAVTSVTRCCHACG